MIKSPKAKPWGFFISTPSRHGRAGKAEGDFFYEGETTGSLYARRQ
jgi:hypothetical protein